MIYDGNNMNRTNFIAPTKCQYNKTTTTTTLPKNWQYNNSDVVDGEIISMKKRLCAPFINKEDDYGEIR